MELSDSSLARAVLTMQALRLLPDRHHQSSVGTVIPSCFFQTAGIIGTVAGNAMTIHYPRTMPNPQVSFESGDEER
jgi:hypothetical protein